MSMMEWRVTIEVIATAAIVLILVFWPTTYALIRRRWLRAAVYFGLTVPVIWIIMNRGDWWGPTDPENDFSPVKNPFLYMSVNLLTLAPILWTITAFSDFLLAEDERARND